MKNYFKNIKLLSKRLFLVIIIYQICRLFFLIFNYKSFDSLNYSAFLGGLRFDLSAIAYINLLFILAHSIIGNFKNQKNYQKILKIFFFSVNSLFIISNFIDIEYFKFTGRRSSYTLITASGMEKDLPRLLSSFVLDYWYILLLLLITLIIFWKLIPDEKFEINTSLSTKNYMNQLCIFILFISLSIIIGRGGFQRVPLKRVHAIQYTKAKNTALVLNTPFCILKTINKKEDIQEKRFFPKQKLDSIYSPIISLKPNQKFNYKNIIIIILESFGDEFIGIENNGKSYTPFLDSLITESLYFKNGFANGKRSIDAVPSIITSIPCLMDNSFISSTYFFNETYGLPKILREKGYNSSFFHGAFNGSQNFDEFSKIAGFDNYYGKNEFPLTDLSDDDGRWGIFDEPFLQFFNQQLSTFKEPFFSTIFTISSHNPFIIPKKYKHTFPKGTSDFHESIGYTDFALKNFFNKAHKENWFHNTLFVITADHTSGDDKKSRYYNNNIGNFSIPIIFFDPSNQNMKGIIKKNIQHIDIMPSILYYLNYSGNFISYGTPFQNKNETIISNYLNDSYHFIIDSLYYNFSEKSINEIYNWKKDSLLKRPLIIDSPLYKTNEDKIKAYIQSFNNRIINNKLNLKSE